MLPPSGHSFRRELPWRHQVTINRGVCVLGVYECINMLAVQFTGYRVLHMLCSHVQNICKTDTDVVL